jgi:hypothetical protein
LLVRGYLFCLFLRFVYWIFELFPQCDIFCYHFIIHFTDEPDVRIESADTITISEGQTLTLKCSFDVGTGLLNVKRIHKYNIEIKGFHTIDSNSSYLTIPNINHTFSGPWECKVQNEVGFGSGFVHINVKCEYD